LASMLGVPVVLVLDTQGMTRGVAPLLLGYQAFDPQLRIAGVILNKVGGPRHEEKLRAVIERYTELPVLGAVARDPRLEIAERHLGLIPGNEAEAAEERIQTIADAVAAQVDLDALMASGAAGPTRAAVSPPLSNGRGLRIAYARDRAFGFYYQEDLDTLRETGVDLVPLDTLRTGQLPQADGLILGGGFPEMFLPELEANRSLQEGIRTAAEAGLPIYAECGGLMYLSRAIRWGDQVGRMVGLIPGEAVMGSRPVGRGYAVLEATGAASLAQPAGRSINAHEFHHSALQGLPEGLEYAYRVARGHGIDGRHDGYVYKNLLASYCHRRGTGAHGWIAPFLDRVRTHARNRNAARLAA
jgi:cobyrinic acid a,c-diamide synthase